MEFMEFMRFVGVDHCDGPGDWRMSVEVLRFACAMMAKEYALGKIKIVVSGEGNGVVGLAAVHQKARLRSDSALRGEGQ